MGHIKVFLGLTIVIFSTLPLKAEEDLIKEVKTRGRYIPELHGGDLGKYTPDEKGKYRHMPVPYDGGYGDRGIKYVPDEKTVFIRPLEKGEFALGPSDRLRFMIDFNYNGSGWQILQFEWNRDDEEQERYNYKNENKLWENEIHQNGQHGGEGSHVDDSKNYYYNYANPNDGEPSESYPEDTQYGDDSYNNQPEEGYAPETENSNGNEHENIHVEGEYNDNNYNLSYMNRNTNSQYDSDRIKYAIKDVLGYIQKHVLPSL